MLCLSQPHSVHTSFHLTPHSFHNTQNFLTCVILRGAQGWFQNCIELDFSWHNKHFSGAPSRVRFPQFEHFQPAPLELSLPECCSIWQQCPWRFLSRGNTGSSTLCHDVGQFCALCPGGRIPNARTLRLGKFQNMGASSTLAWV